ncbi:MAG TPA: DUF58 domain-containing protein [Acidimicrobiales bacterium]|nr:DUF58 domain-containing protein [Acidimicrobiales bacterium]
MLTRRGWMVGLGTVLLATTGRVLGLVELFMLAGAGLALLAAAVAFVRLTRFDLVATRELRPARVHAGGASRVELTARNDGRRRSPVLSARDPFEGGRRWARFLVAPLAAGESARAAYRLPTDRRGVFELGPLELRLEDPFGLAAVGSVAAPVTRLTVYPRIDDIPPLPLTRGNDPHAGADHPTALASAGEDFYALREYELGDDLRRVHWKATARLGELMIRQDEMPWQGRATVLVDLRREVHSSRSFELAVSAAASIVNACWRHRSLVRLVGTDGVDLGFAAGHGHVEAILEHLAGVGAERGTSLAPILSSLRKEGNGGALAVVTTAAAPRADLEQVARLRNRFGSVTLVLLDQSVLGQVPGGGVPEPPPVPGVRTIVRVGTDRPFAAAWTAAVAGGQRASAAGGRR